MQGAGMGTLSAGFRFVPTALLAALLTASVAAGAGGLRITRVTCEPARFDPQAGESVRIAYRLSAPAEATLRIYDARELEVRRVPPAGRQTAGEHVAEWDGRDAGGAVVPPYYYTYVLTARGADGETVVHDLTDATGGRPLAVPTPRHDAANGEVSYVLPAAAIVNLRAGLPDGGPLLATIVDWVARPGGLNREPWDGWDASRAIDLSTLEHLRIGLSAYELPANAVIVTAPGSRRRPRFIDAARLSGGRRTPETGKPGRMYDHWKHPRDRCYDPRVRVIPPAELPRTTDGLPRIAGPVPLTVTVAPADRRYMLDQRFEIVVYVDFVFVFEEELGYTPFTWKWNPEGVNPGIHYLTVMLRGYEGHFGTETVKVRVDDPS